MIDEAIQRKLQNAGIDYESLKKNFQNYVGLNKAFATPQEYAQGIMEKEAQGVSLDDQRTADQFKQIMPELFGKRRDQTEIPIASRSTSLPEHIDPRTKAMIESIAQHQRDNPIIIPFAPGTPTQRRREADEAARAAQVREALEKEKFAWQQEQAELDRQLAERKFAADQAYRSWQMEQANKQVEEPGIMDNIRDLITRGVDWDVVRDYVKDVENQLTYKKYNVDENMVMEQAWREWEDFQKNFLSEIDQEYKATTPGISGPQTDMQLRKEQLADAYRDYANRLWDRQKEWEESRVEPDRTAYLDILGAEGIFNILGDSMPSMNIGYIEELLKTKEGRQYLHNILQ